MSVSTEPGGVELPGRQPVRALRVRRGRAGQRVRGEKKEDADGKISGYIRIRSKTQGIALSLGDRITAVQRSADVESAKKNGHL
jgi:hypothetical protein